MLMVFLLFWTLVLLSCAYASITGGPDGRRASALVILASLASITGGGSENWIQTQYQVFIVDGIMLIALVAIALHSKSYWPIWMSAFQFNAVGTHIATFVSQDYAASIYRGLSGFWALPAILSMVIGIYLDNAAGWKRGDPTKVMPI